MRRFSLWLRGKPMVADSILAAALVLFDLLTLGGKDHAIVYLILGLLVPVPVIWRRSYPRASAVALLVLSITTSAVSVVLHEDLQPPALLAVGVALYTLVAYVGRREGLLYLIGLAVDGAFSLAVVDQSVPIVIGFLVMFYALCWTLAEFLGARHAYDAEVAARLAVADYDRERSAHDAVSTERTRIARELHDVVAHAVSVIIVQADGAKYALRRDPEIAEQALATIAATGREALRELRRTVELLRTEHAPEQLPQHGTAGLAKVVEMMRSAGLAVELELTGELDDVAPEVSLGMHRIVQESLTNTFRHAGPDPQAWVRVRRRDTDVLVEVLDRGDAGPSATGSTVAAKAPVVDDTALRNGIAGSGLGLVGMRERIAVLGGTLEVGRRPEGGWRVCATIPLQRELPD
ncbi:signal transduction histidine kinase [Nocardia kruczakiae]|uniref:histidine kinase n=1 Tax=Nocardia kruczakiae TaxID=261477 RepID=A0ABU1X8Y7_9NOCA|nr:histidine kinase [Nocardia kruczakiae]MDR7167000.1 signal transduction histidine kinase [Nocardia kruczakiae]